MRFRKFMGLAAALCVAASGQRVGATTAIQFHFIDAGGAAPDSQLYKTMTIAGDYWSSILSTQAPVTFNVKLSTADLSGSALAVTHVSQSSYSVASVEAALAARQGTSFDALATAALPTLSNGALAVYTPGYTDVAARTGIDNQQRVYDTDGSFNNKSIALTSADAKALGVTFASDHIDGSIAFTTRPVLDFDPTDGIGPNTSDGLGAAIHELGHLLGYDSGVDSYDETGTGGIDALSDCGGYLCENSPANDQYWGYALDLYRYSADGVLDWTTKTASYFSLDGGATAFLNGYYSTGTYNGDGNQASHWLDNSYDIGPTCAVPKTPSLGIMDPTSGRCEARSVTALDIAALDAIGYESTVDVLANPTYSMSTAAIARLFGGGSDVPEPASWAMLVGGFGLLGGALRRRPRTVPTLA